MGARRQFLSRVSSSANRTGEVFEIPAYAVATGPLTSCWLDWLPPSSTLRVVSVQYVGPQNYHSNPDHGNANIRESSVGGLTTSCQKCKTSPTRRHGLGCCGGRERYYRLYDGQADSRASDDGGRSTPHFEREARRQPRTYPAELRAPIQGKCVTRSTAENRIRCSGYGNTSAFTLLAVKGSARARTN